MMRFLFKVKAVVFNKSTLIVILHLDTMLPTTFYKIYFSTKVKMCMANSDLQLLWNVTDVIEV